MRPFPAPLGQQEMMRRSFLPMTLSMLAVCPQAQEALFETTVLEEHYDSIEGDPRRLSEA